MLSDAAQRSGGVGRGEGVGLSYITIRRISLGQEGSEGGFPSRSLRVSLAALSGRD